MAIRRARLAATAAALLVVRAAHGGQDALVADTDIHGPTLNFDWQDIQVGVGTYEEGPTGLTIIRFMLRAAVVVDSRGGAPGTVIQTRFASATPRLARTRSSSPAARSMARKLSLPS